MSFHQPPFYKPVMDNRRYESINENIFTKKYKIEIENFGRMINLDNIA